MKRTPLSVLVFTVAIFGGIFAGRITQIETGDRSPGTALIDSELLRPTVDHNAGNPETRLGGDGVDSEIRPEVFTDEKLIGRRGRNKVEVTCLRNEAGTRTHITFYTRTANGSLEQKQSFEFQKLDQLPCDPRVKDLNGDGQLDLTYRSDEAARGANEIRTLFIYDRKIDALVYIENSADYPNLRYNARLKCLDAWVVSGGADTVFLRVKGNRLEEFASVSTGFERIAELISPDGQRQVISRKKMRADDVYTRYVTYDPPR